MSVERVILLILISSFTLVFSTELRAEKKPYLTAETFFSTKWKHGTDVMSPDGTGRSDSRIEPLEMASARMRVKRFHGTFGVSFVNSHPLSLKLLLEKLFSSPFGYSPSSISWMQLLIPQCHVSCPLRRHTVFYSRENPQRNLIKNLRPAPAADLK